MAVDYQLIFYNTSGARQAIVTDFTGLAYAKRVNAPGLLQFSLKGDHGLLASLADRWYIEVYRKPEGAAWACDFTALYREGPHAWSYGEKGSVFTAQAPGILSLLSARVVNYYANYASRTKFTSAAAETVMKSLVQYNITSDATTGNGRKRLGTQWPATWISLQADGAAGSTVDWFCHGENLLETLQKLSAIAGGDFDLVKTAATTFQFRWYTGQLGTDRSATVRFAMELGNMAEPVYRRWGDKATVAAVWGKGEEASRTYATRTGTNYATTLDLEMYVGATDVDTTAGLNSRGDEKLDEAKAKEEFSFKALETPSTRYGVHYGLGDKVTAVNPFSGASSTLKVGAVSVSIDEGGAEEITPEFETP